MSARAAMQMGRAARQAGSFGGTKLKFVLFYHSLISDWNHGNAHFLRGVASELIERGTDVVVMEPANAWSMENLLKDAGASAVRGFREAFPNLRSVRYNLQTLDLDHVLDGADVVIVHEWSDHALVANIGQHHRRNPGYVLLFHDTHHRIVSKPEEMAQYDLREYDGVLAFGGVIRDLYLERGWTGRAWTWHEAADTRVFRPMQRDKRGHLVWIGNWGDGERTVELQEYLLQSCQRLGLRACMYGVRYPDAALRALEDARVQYCGWAPNYKAPEIFAEYKVTVHIPRGPYIETLPGVPTIRPFEAMACGIPLVSKWWDDCEHLFRPGRDYLVARTPDEMRKHLRDVLNDRELAQSLVRHGLETIRRRHTCAHRVDELLGVVAELQETETDKAVSA